jgi:hypothetical protein
MLNSSRLIDLFSCNSRFDPFFITLMFNLPSSNSVAFFSSKASAFNFPACYIDQSFELCCWFFLLFNFPACISDSLTCCSGFQTSSSGSLVPLSTPVVQHFLRTILAIQRLYLEWNGKL